MSQKTHHGDSRRDNNFWVSPRNRQLQNPQWDTHDANDLCNNHSFLGTDSEGLQRYKCNGHNKFKVHADPSRDNNFWVYPRNQALQNPQWDTHDANDLCNNHTYLGTDGQGLQKYRCNGH